MLLGEQLLVALNWAITMDKSQAQTIKKAVIFLGKKLFNDWGGRDCRKFFPALGEDGSKTAPPWDVFDQPPGELSWIRGKLADHVKDHAVLYPEGTILVTTMGTESIYPRPPIVDRLEV